MHLRLCYDLTISKFVAGQRADIDGLGRFLLIHTELQSNDQKKKK